MQLKPRNLFLLLASFGGIMALIFGVFVNPSVLMPLRPHLTTMFSSMAGVMLVISIIYLLMEKVKRPISDRLGMSHYIITLVAVACGIICTVTAHDGIDNAAWTRVPSFLSVKLFLVSVAVFLFAIASAVIRRKSLQQR